MKLNQAVTTVNPQTWPKKLVPLVLDPIWRQISNYGHQNRPRNIALHDFFGGSISPFSQIFSQIDSKFQTLTKNPGEIHGPG